MGNERSSKEEILRYIGDGWRFRVRTVKGRRYITRRRRQEEKGMGPYDAGLWDLIGELADRGKPEKEAPALAHRFSESEGKAETGSGEVPDWRRRHESFKERQRELEKELSQARAAQMIRSCIHHDSENFCDYWIWDKKDRFFTILDELHGGESYKKKKIYLEGKMVDRWIVRTFIWYCSTCSAYRPRAR